MKARLFAVIATLGCALSGANASTIVNNFDGTFTDNTTGIRWENIAAFYPGVPSEISLALLPGFVFATESQVMTLATDTGITSSTPLSDVQTIATAMGSSPFLIWGRYGDGTKWAFTYGIQAPFPPGWEFNDAAGADFGSSNLGAFALDPSTVSETPLPAALPLFASGALLGFLGWRRNRKVR